MASPPEATPTKVIASFDKHTLTEDDKSADADATSSTIDTGPRCYILELPRELRDMIYDRVLEDTPAVPSRNTKKKVATRAALLRGNKQIYTELTERALYGPGLIQTRVVNFQFAHIIMFLNRLPDDFIQKMTPEGSNKPAKKPLHIQLHFFSDPDQHGMISRLRRWLNRLATEKRGAHIEVRYATDEVMNDGGFKRVDKRVISGAMIPYAKESVQYKEGDKIWGALLP